MGLLDGTIARGEDRTIKFGPFDSAPAGSEGWSYRIGFRAAKSGADLTSVDFGPSEYQAAGTHALAWLVPLPAAKSALLTAGMVWVGVWRTGAGTEYLVNAGDDYVMVLDRPGNA